MNPPIEKPKSKKFKLSFGGRIAAFVFLITLVSSVSITFYFLKTYYQEKKVSVFESELYSTNDKAFELEILINAMRSLSPFDWKNFKSLVLTIDHPCMRGGNVPEIHLSPSFARILDDTHLKIDQFTRDPEVVKYCRRALSNDSNALSAHIIPLSFRFFFPVVGIWSPDRLVVMIAETISDQSDMNFLYITDQKGDLVWSSSKDKEQTENQAIQEEISKIILNSSHEKTLGIHHLNNNFIAVFSGISQDYFFISAKSLAFIFSGVRATILKIIFLVCGVFFMSFWLGRLFSRTLAKPIQELTTAAEAIGAGDFSIKFDLTEADEVSSVKSAFNTMGEKIKDLINLTKREALVESQIELTKQVQSMLLPSDKERAKEHEITSYVKMADECGGDFWGYVDLDTEKGHRFILMIGDVEGHGIASALPTATIRGALTVLTAWIKSNPDLSQDPNEILRIFNRVIFEATKGSVFMSFLVCVFDTEQNKANFASAGHPAPFSMNTETGSPPTGISFHPTPLLGMSGDTVFEKVFTIDWVKGSSILFYTDGLKDCPREDGKNAFNDKTCIKTLRTVFDMKPANFILNFMLEREKKVKGIPQIDDVTVVLCKRV